MGYVEKVMGDKERAVYQTHQHAIVLIGRIVGWLFAFLVFLGLGLAVLRVEDDRFRFVVGLVALGSLVMPGFLIFRIWRRTEQREDIWKHLWRPVLAAVVVLVVALMLMFGARERITGWVAVVLALFPLFEVVRGTLDWLNERYIITNRRVMEVKGIVNKHVRDSALEKVNDVDLTQSVVGRVLGYGTVQIITGSDIGVNRFRRIANPVRFKREMLNAKEQLHSPLDEDVPAKPEAVPGLTPAADEASITNLIEELAELRQKGVLSEEEFQAKKKELLARL